MTAVGKALVVDDSSVNRLLLVRRLETLGLEVMQAENGVLALELLAANPGAVDVPYVMKEHERKLAKDAIASAACELVRDGDSVLLDSGSTTHQLAIALSARNDLTIVTNDLLIGRLVADYPGVHLLVTGGELLSSTYTLCGEHAVTFIEDLRVDWAFLGADAIDAIDGITNTNTLEIPIKRAMIAAGRSTVVLADSTKFGRRALVRVAELHEVDQLITDDELTLERAAPYGEQVRRTPQAAEPSQRIATVGELR